jgi:hypothetical protein
LIATIRDREQQIDAERIRNRTDQVDELADKAARLEEELERCRACTTHRVLISATKDETIEVFADPGVKVQCVCIPDTRTPEEFEKAVEWAVGKLPSEFREMIHEETIRPNLFSVHCMDRVGWRYYRNQVEAIGYVESLEAAVETLTTETKGTAQENSDDEPW